MAKAIQWHEISPADVEGKGWSDTGKPFARLPERIKEQLPDVWPQAQSSIGMCVFFNTDSSSFHVKYTLGTGPIGESNFNVTAHSGTDLYVYDTAEKRWRWAAATPHSAIKDRNPEVTLIDEIPGKMRRCRLYFPMRNEVSNFSIGVDSGAKFELVAPRKKKPLVYYGTSIIHGAFAIRSGLGTAQIVARELDLPLINLGFSGAARLEPEMAELLAEQDAKLFVIDPYHNLSPEMVKGNTETFIEILCSKRPKIPVVMLGAPQHLHAWLKPGIQKSEDEKTHFYGKICRRMMKKYPNLHYLKGSNFYGSDEVSMDGVHPNDEAFSHMAKILVKKFSKLIE